MKPLPTLLFLAVVALGAAPSILAQPQLAITEFMASNGRTLADEDGDHPDWIEIHNASATTVNLQDWSLTDLTNHPTRWTFPSTNLAANAYLVVFASGKDRRVPGKRLHTSFSLNADGEYLALVDPEGEVVSAFAPHFPAQRSDVSYGSWQGRMYFFTQPTPGAANTEGVNDFVADTRFSQDRGFHDQPFDLAITTATPGAAIYWSTNGTPPTALTLTNTNVFRYTGPLRIAGTTVVRAAAFKDGMEPSNVDTQSYLFTADIIRQSPTGQAPPGWPTSWGANVRDYGMDPDIVNDARYRDTIQDDLKSIPSFCLVMDLPDLFNSSRGIYANPGQDGRAWERKASLELVHPDGTDGFQVDCGVRIRGGFSRSTDNPKHAFRLFFREEYGSPKLNYPLFGDDGADRFDGVDLRTFQNYSWSFQGDPQGVFLRDQFSRDSQLDMGHQAERGRFYHLFINGQYWGLFNTCERPEASYGETYYGGRKEDFDVIKVSADNGYTIGATDGNMQAWTRLYMACKAGLTNDVAYEKILGNNPDGTRNPDYEELVDVDNLIDYMLVILYGGNLDAPISNFLGNSSPNNWFGMRDRTGRSGGFRFFAHDAEHTLLNVNENRIGPFAAGNSSVSSSSPQWVWQKMWANAEFRLRCADRVHRHFFNGGALAPEVAQARFALRTNEIHRAVVGESARWGDAKRSTPFTRENWRSQAGSILNGYLVQRGNVVLGQLRSKQLYPNVVAPAFSQRSGVIPQGSRITVNAPAGTVYYTLDGSDPRLRGGAVAPGARVYGGPLDLPESARLKSRALVGATWSALNEATFILAQDFTGLLVTELMYHPAATADTDGEEFEFVELKNTNPFAVELSGVSFVNGIRSTFPLGTKLGAGQFAVLVKDAAAFAARHPGVPVAGVYTGSLANSGERVTLAQATGTNLFSVNYDDAAPWPLAADGGGFSLVPRDPNANPLPDDAASWRASSRIGGSPGADDPPTGIPKVVVNEALTHTDPPQRDAIELHNPTAQPADISGWYLTDDRSVPAKYRFPASSVIPAGGYLVRDELDFNPAPGTDASFNLSSHGEEVFLFSADAGGALTGYADGFAFGAAANGVSFGRHTNRVGEWQFTAQLQTTFGQGNAGPRIGPVVLNEIHYQPAVGDLEFVELKNLSAQAVALFHPLHPTNPWRLRGVDFDFPPNTVLPPGGLVVVAGSDPIVFRTRNGIPDTVPVFGPFQGTLQNNGEWIEIQQPDAPDLVTNSLGELKVVVPFVTIDAVRYNDKAPWPTNAAGFGPSLERLQAAAYGNDPLNWRASFGRASPGLDNDGNRRPLARAGLDQSLDSVTFPIAVTLAGSGIDDGLPASPGRLTYRWTQLSGPGVAVFNDDTQSGATVHLPGAGEFVLRLTVSDGDLQTVDDLAIAITRPAGPLAVVAAGAEWLYLDDGSNQGTAWRAPGFADSGWKKGRALFGYGDGDEITAVNYGPDSSSKYVTTYFRKRFTIADAASIQNVTLRILRDDGVAIHLNGQEVARDNLPEGTLNYRSLASDAIGGADERTFIERVVDPGNLRTGENVIAVELHQNAGTSSDLAFDLALEIQAFPANQPPTVNAGPDLRLALSEVALLAGLFTDDGLPAPPGFTTLTWSKLSGPGDVAWANPGAWRTSASFSRAGQYVLRLTANDGLVAVHDDMQVTVEGHGPPRFDPPELVDGEVPALRLRFVAEAGATYSLQARSSLATGDWETIGTVAAGESERRIERLEPIDPEGSGRYFRIVTE
ncbi:MAG: lamin tail domain-containing protein [Limisphaerales bacterium]